MDRTTATANRWVDYLVWPVALWASFFNLLNFHDYPLFRAEVLLVVLVLAAIGTLMAMVQRTARPRLSFLFTGLFAAIMIDLGVAIGLDWFCALWVGLTIVCYFAESALLRLTLAAFTAVLLFQLATLTTGIGDQVRPENQAQNLQAKARSGATRPAIVHLVLDSYLGLDAMAQGPEVYRELRAEQAAFFAARGFQLYPRAYSRHARTMNSLPYLFAYGAPPAVRYSSTKYAVPDELGYFTDLDKRGYRISVVTPAYVDFCVKQPLSHCRTFESSGLTSMLGFKLGVVDRARILGLTLLGLTNIPNEAATTVQRGLNGLFGTAGRWPYNRARLFPLTSLNEMDRFTAGLADLKPGEVRLAHFLLPHDPYMLTPECVVKPEATHLDEHGPGSAADREKGYADQVRCLQRRIDKMLVALDRTKAGREAIVVLHGDHGSRIAPIEPYIGGPELTQREMLMSHAAFFAIRVPGETAGEVPGTYALDELMAGFRDRDFASAPRPKEMPARVVMMDRNLQPSEWRPLPQFEAQLSSP
jgi:hypothetical protein